MKKKKLFQENLELKEFTENIQEKIIIFNSTIQKYEQEMEKMKKNENIYIIEIEDL